MTDRNPNASSFYKRLLAALGPKELASLTGTGVVALGLGLIYFPLAPIWVGSAILFTVWLTLPTAPRNDN